jgi:hypothetical protein
MDNRSAASKIGRLDARFGQFEPLGEQCPLFVVSHFWGALQYPVAAFPGGKDRRSSGTAYLLQRHRIEIGKLSLCFFRHDNLSPQRRPCDQAREVRLTTE